MSGRLKTLKRVSGTSLNGRCLVAALFDAGMPVVDRAASLGPDCLPDWREAVTRTAMSLSARHREYNGEGVKTGLADLDRATGSLRRSRGSLSPSSRR